MVNYLKVDNYGCFVNFLINFSSLNMLLGSNGTGKSTLFKVIAALRYFIQDKSSSKTQCVLISHHPGVIDNLAASRGIF